MRQRVVWASVTIAGCGLFPSVTDFGPDGAVDGTVVDALGDAASDLAAYADVRIPCQLRPCLPQIGETCCWFADAADTCNAPDAACTGEADLACYGSIQCLAVGKTACCHIDKNIPVTLCTDLASCQKAGGTVLCDRPPMEGGIGDPSDNTCPAPLSCTGTNNIQGYAFRSCH